MKILLIGVTGPTGKRLLDTAERSSDEITCLVRHPDKLGEVADGVRIVQGDATVVGDLVPAMQGKDAVICTLGRGKSTKAEGLFTSAAKAIVSTMEHEQVKRLVWMSSFGVGDTFKDANLIQKVMYSTMLRNIYKNKKESEEFIHGSTLDWTIVYPTALMDEPATGQYVTGEHLAMKFPARINRADVAGFMFKCAHEDEWIHEDVEINGIGK